jgi:hypothetical protein
VKQQQPWQPRYVLFAQAHGHTPEQQMLADDKAWPGGIMTGFICWIGERWREFCREHAIRNADAARLKYGDEVGAMFDNWLTGQVGATKTTERKEDHASHVENQP